MYVATVVCAMWVSGASADRALLAHWPMEGVADGRLTDVSGRGHHAVLSGEPASGPEVVDGMVGRALRFPDKHTLAFTAEKSGDFNLAKGLTVMAWVRPAVGNRNMEILCKKGDRSGKPPWPGWRFRFFWRRAMFQFGTADGQEPRAGSADWSVPSGFWSHVAATYDGHTIRIYVNAVEKAVVSCKGPILAQRRPLVLANYVGRKNAYPFIGILDEVKVFSRVLTRGEILVQAVPPSIEHRAHLVPR